GDSWARPSLAQSSCSVTVQSSINRVRRNPTCFLAGQPGQADSSSRLPTQLAPRHGPDARLRKFREHTPAKFNCETRRERKPLDHALRSRQCGEKNRRKSMAFETSQHCTNIGIPGRMGNKRTHYNSAWNTSI